MIDKFLIATVFLVIMLLAHFLLRKYVGRSLRAVRVNGQLYYLSVYGNLYNGGGVDVEKIKYFKFPEKVKITTSGGKVLTFEKCNVTNWWW